MRSLEIVRIRGETREILHDRITEEISLRVLAGHRRLVELVCSPADLEDLVRGFFFTNGLIHSSDHIQRVVVNRSGWSAFVELAPEIDPDTFRLRRVIGSACASAFRLEEEAREEEGEGSGTVNGSAAAEGGHHRDRQKRCAAEAVPGALSGSAAGLTVSSGQIGALMEQLRERSEVHRQTGGVHAAGLADRKRILVFREDIGRHNAVDKVIGAFLKQGGDFRDKLLLSSGRLSSEILQKAEACALPIVVSRSAPTDRCVALARKRDITLIGFARGRRLNIYSAEQRVRVGDV